MDKDDILEAYKVNAIDRKYNFWKWDSLNIELFTAVSPLLACQIYLENSINRLIYCNAAVVGMQRRYEA